MKILEKEQFKSREQHKKLLNNARKGTARWKNLKEVKRTVSVQELYNLHNL